MVTLTSLLDEAGIRLCVVCGASVESRRDDAQTCSPRCRKAKSRGHKSRRFRQARVERWSRAAEKVDYNLGEFIARTLDIAATDLLDGESRLERRLR